MKVKLTIASLFLVGINFAQSTFGEIVGSFSNNEGTVPGVLVYTTRGEEKFSAITNEEGRFRISALPAGKYDLKFVLIDENDTVEGGKTIEVIPEGIAQAGNFKYNVTSAGDPTVYAQIIYLTNGHEIATTLKRKDILQSSVRTDVAKMITGSNSDVQRTTDGDLVFRGARPGDYINIIDGIKTNQIFNLPSSGIGYIMVYSGAIPAKYGDTTGGVVVMETVSYFDLLREYQNRK